MPSIEGGGVEKNFFLVCNYLVKKIKYLKVITVSKNHKKRFDKSIILITPSSGIWDRLGRRMKYLVAILLLIKEIKKNKNIIIFSFQANIYCILICKLFSVKVITRSNTAPIGWSKNFIKRFIFKKVLKLSDKVMVNSIQFKKDLKKELSIKSECIYNPLNKNEIVKKSKKKSKKIFNTVDKLKILNIGRFTEQKDQLTFLRSLKYIKGKINFEACMVGRGILKGELQKYIVDNNLKDYVKIIEFLENPYPLMRQSDLFVLTSKYEGLPNVLLEALALKKFIISSSCHTGPKEILLNGKGGLLFKVGDHKELANKIMYYFFNKKKCAKLLQKSYKSLNRFDYNENLFKYYKLINSF
tara:strand:+ start:366 stop:1433 length:1068 start_codon:yes stop_codon:yes gene_type:complete